MNWPVLLNGLKDFLLVVVLGYVLKLMHQQNELLKADKSLKESEISLHKAKIGHLRSLRAPGLAPDLEQIADKYAEKKRQLEEKVTAVEQKVRAVEEQVKALDGESEPGAAAQVKAFYSLQTRICSCERGGNSPSRKIRTDGVDRRRFRD